MSQKVFNIIKYLCFFALFYVLFNAKIGVLQSFAFGMYFCLVWCGQNIGILSVGYVLSAFLFNFNVLDVICAGSSVLIFCLFYFLHYKFKKPLNQVLIGIYGFLSQVVYLYFHTGSASDFFDAVLSVACGLVFLYCCLHFVQNVLLRGVKRKFYIDEIICAGVLVTVLGAGLYNMPFGQFLSLGICTLMILVSVWCFGTSKAIVVATLLGLGMSLSTQNISFIVRFVLLGVGASAMQSNRRIFSALAVILLDIVLELYLMPVYTLTTIISVSIGALVFLFLPKKFLTFVSSLVITEQQNNAVYNMLERNRKSLEERLNTLSNVFMEMRQAFLSMVKNNYNSTDVINTVSQQIVDEVCSKCPNKNDCLVLNAQETDYYLHEMCKYAYTRSKINIVDVTPNFARKCIRLPVLINTINHNTKDYRQVTFDNQSNNECKLMIAEQLFGVSEVFKSMSNDVAVPIQFDIDKENEIIENLAKVQVLCTECLVYNTGNDLNVSLTIKERDLLPDRIVKVVSSTLNTYLQVHSTVHSTTKSFVNIVLKSRDNYDFVFGCAGATKQGSKVSGDTYSVTRLCNGQILFSICDGMGSGKNAEHISKMSISLIENFYKAGFDSSVTLRIVNNLLSQRGEDDFSAIDLGVINLQTGVFNLYKVGAPCSFIKKEKQTKILNAGALPLGIVKEIKPHIESVVLNDGEFIILLSDGVVDSFCDTKRLCSLINNLDNQNPQLLANDILELAVHASDNAPKDDMTVLVGKIVRKF